jgi:hypothetical protein
MLVRPTYHIQRFVEQLRFIPSGGQQWTRTLQVRIPATATPIGRSWRIVSLGQFKRQRFPDIFVTDAHGTRVNLLTGQQHGEALRRVTLAFHLLSLPEATLSLITTDEVAKNAYNKLSQSLFDFSTRAGDMDEAHIARLVDIYDGLLRSLNISSNEAKGRINDFADDCRETGKATRYLCWVEAEPGQVVNLQVVYTVKDPLHDVGVESTKELWKKARDGFSKDGTRRKKAWGAWYRDFGIAPHNYEFDIPSPRQVGSYYLTIEPPEGTEVAYLDWEASNTIDDRELDCAYKNAHIHNSEGVDNPPSSDVARAYLRCSPHHHKQIIGSTVLNLLLVYFVALGRLPSKVGESTQSFLIVVPSVLIAYLVQQQRHYYANALMRLRGVLWIYLAVSVLFIVAIVFSRYDPALGSSSLGTPTTVLAWALVLISAGVFAWFLPLGHNYERLAQYLMKKVQREDKDTLAPDVVSALSSRIALRWPARPKWFYYQEAIRRLSNRVVIGILVAMTSMVFFMRYTWYDPPKPKLTKKAPESAHAWRGNGAFTWLSGVCKECSGRFHFLLDPVTNK